MSRSSRIIPYRAAAAVWLLAAASPHAAAAVTVTPCGDGPRADALAEPWEANTATYAEGSIRIAAIDTVEPAAAAFSLMVLSPPRDELGLRQCRLVGESEATGFFGMDFAARTARYEAGRGLVLTLPVKRFDPASGEGRPALLSVVIDQTTGVTATIR